MRKGDIAAAVGLSAFASCRESGEDEVCEACQACSHEAISARRVSMGLDSSSAMSSARRMKA